MSLNGVVSDSTNPAIMRPDLPPAIATGSRFISMNLPDFWGDRRPTLQPVRGVTYEPSLPNGMRRACGREAIRLERRRHRGSSSSSVAEFSTRY